MKIDSIFANDTLFAVRYQDDGENELKRLLDLWSNPTEVYNYVKENGGDLLINHSIAKLSKMIREEVEYIDDILNKLKDNPAENLNNFFIPLNSGDSEFLPLGKKKGKKNGFTFLRLYAIKIADNCYLVTGGAIKLTARMGGSDDTERALGRLDIVRTDLYRFGVKGEKDFFEFIKFQNEE